MLYKLLSDSAEAFPEKEAIICGSQRFNYAQFKDRVDRLAAALVSTGIKKDQKIAVIHKNCHRFLEIYFAAVKIGSILVPMNYRLTPDDFIFMLNDSQAKILMAQPDLVQWISEKREKLFALEKIILTKPDMNNVFGSMCFFYEDFIEKSFPDDEEVLISQGLHTAQIYYTSGTTGRPKGVLLTHLNNASHSSGAITELNLNSRDRWLHVSPLFHLADAWAVWGMTQVAATHVVIPEFSAKAVLQIIEEHSVTLSNFIPTMLNTLVNFPDIDQYDLSSLRLILSGGAPIAQEVVRKVIQKFGSDYIQTYGLTETSPFLTMSILKDEMKHLPFEDRLRYKMTTGRPFRNVELKIVKEDMSEVVPDGNDVGEIIAKGETVTPGYWRLPEETSKRIVNSWFHTRDLAVVNSEGYVTIVDRIDDMIITGGENVYSIEIEGLLYSHPSILEAAVIGLPDSVWGEIVTAVIVVKPHRKLNEDGVIDFCRGQLASFKIPKRVIFTDYLPKTGSEKLYKHKLREMYCNKE